MRGVLSTLFTIAAVIGLAGALGVGAGKVLYERDGPLTEETVAHIDPGQSLRSVADELAEQGVIDHPIVLRAAARALGVGGAVKAGDYAFEPGVSMREVLDRITEGRAIEHRVTVAEGLTVQEVAELVRAMEVLVGDIETLPAEGMLAPDTYFVRRGETRQAVIERMRTAQERRLAALWDGRAEDLPITTPEEALILASIIEKETAVPNERGVVASVFVNRLREGMKLQTDPTVIYGITRGAGPLDRALTRTDLRTPTEYNTYVIPALPPTPIANPGKDSIAAALNPAESEYRFFVADGTGGHAFARTYDEHRRNVAVWREIERSRRAAGG